MSRRVLRGGAWADDALQQLPQSASVWLQGNCTVLKRDSHSLVALGEIGGQVCYLKLYTPKNRLQGALFALGRCRAVDAYDAAEALMLAGIAVPAARACLLLEEGVLLAAEGLPAARDLKAMWTQGLPEAEGHALMYAAGDALARLHSAGFAHGDCKWSNLLWHQQRCYLVDLEAVVRCEHPHRRQARDIARFTVNAEDLGVDAEAYGCFLEAYRTHCNLDYDALYAAMAADLKRLRARHLKKYGARGAPLV